MRESMGSLVKPKTRLRRCTSEPDVRQAGAGAGAGAAPLPGESAEAEGRIMNAGAGGGAAASSAHGAVASLAGFGAFGAAAAASASAGAGAGAGAAALSTRPVQRRNTDAGGYHIIPPGSGVTGSYGSSSGGLGGGRSHSFGQTETRAEAAAADRCRASSMSAGYD